MIEAKTIDDKVVWNDFIEGHLEANFLQSYEWGEFHKSRGKKILRRGIYLDGQLVGAYTGHVESSRRGSFAQIPGGPIIDWTNKELVSACLDDIHLQSKNSGCVYARIRPQEPETPAVLATLESNGLKKSPIYLSVELAGVLDLTKPEEEILKGMRQRLRRALRKAEKNNIQIETSTDPEDIEEFYKIQLETAGRHQFTAFSKDFLKKQFQAFAESGDAVLYTAKYEGQILAQNFMIFYGHEASYHYGVSTALGTKLSGAPLLHMQAMRDARRQGIERYNFWGIVPEDDTKHRFYGVSVFKRGFGVEELQYTKAHDIIIKKIPYLLTYLIDRVRQVYRHV